MMEGIEGLPADVLLHVFSYLSQVDTLRLSQISKSWQSFIENNPVFRSLLLPGNITFNVTRTIDNLIYQKRFQWLSEIIFSAPCSSGKLRSQQLMMIHKEFTERGKQEEQEVATFSSSLQSHRNRIGRFRLFKILSRMPTMKPEVVASNRHIILSFFGSSDIAPLSSQAGPIATIPTDVSRLDSISLRARLNDPEVYWILRPKPFTDSASSSSSSSPSTFSTSPLEVEFENFNPFSPIPRESRLLSLKRLDLTNCAISGEGLRSVFATQPHLCSNLVSLNLGCCGNVTDEGLKALLPLLPSLVSLDLFGLAIEDRTLELLSTVGTRLEALDLSDCWNLTSRGLSSFFQTVRFSPGLKVLGLGSLEFSLEEMWMNTTISRSLTELDLTIQRSKNGWFVSGTGLPDSELTVRGLCQSCPKLETICLESSVVSDETLQVLLREFINIRSLNLVMCSKVTGGGLLKALWEGRPKGLRYLNLRSAPLVRREDVEELKRRFPSSRIKSDFNLDHSWNHSLLNTRQMLVYKRFDEDLVTK